MSKMRRHYKATAIAPTKNAPTTIALTVPALTTHVSTEFALTIHVNEMDIVNRQFAVGDIGKDASPPFDGQ